MRYPLRAVFSLPAGGLCGHARPNAKGAWHEQVFSFQFPVFNIIFKFVIESLDITVIPIPIKALYIFPAHITYDFTGRLTNRRF